MFHKFLIGLRNDLSQQLLVFGQSKFSIEFGFGFGFSQHFGIRFQVLPASDKQVCRALSFFMTGSKMS